jgi:SsrA-binding protein
VPLGTLRATEDVMAKGKKTKKDKGGDGTQLIASYKRAYRDYDILDTYEAGLVLTGSEVKSLREGGNSQIAEGYARVQRGEMWLEGIHIPPYTNAIGFGAHDPDRPRKLLLNRAEIDKLDQRVAQGSLTVVPLRLYWKGGRAKVQLGLAKGRTKGDKRQHLAERDSEREIQTAINRANKYGTDR